MLIMQDALPLFKSFLKPVSLKQQARQLVLRCVIAFLMHLGKMSASRVAGAVRTDARHRAQVSRFLGRRYWRRCDLLGQLRAQLLEMEARQGTFVFDIDQTYCSQQGKLTENTIIRGEKTKRPKKSKKKQKKYAQRSSHCFVMGLLITPSGMRLPFSVSYYTEAYCKAKKIAYRKQTELAAQLIRQLPLPPEARVVVLGDTAFDAKAIRTACEERKFSWIVPINPERVLAGEKPRPKVSSLSEDLTADQMVCLKVHPGKGKYVDYRRISRYRIGPKFKPRTYYVHEESRDVHSVGKVRLFFSTTKAPAQGHRVEVQKTLMTNDAKLTLRDVIELYQLRWQIELFFKELEIYTWFASLPLQGVREGGNLGHALPGDVRLFGVDSSAQIETESAEEEREGVVANSANLRIGPGRASGSRTARTEATGGEDGDTHRAKSACQAAPAVTSQGVPRGDLIGGSQKAQLQKVFPSSSCRRSIFVTAPFPCLAHKLGVVHGETFCSRSSRTPRMIAARSGCDSSRFSISPRADRGSPARQKQDAALSLLRTARSASPISSKSAARTSSR